MRPRGREPDRVTDWAAIRQRVELAGAIGGATELSPERARAVLQARAAALARPAAASPQNTIELMTFRLANETYAIESRYVTEVFPLSQLAALPGAKPPVFGVTAWRGRLLTVLDIRSILGVSATALDDLGRVIVLGQERAVFGILADAIDELVRLALSDVREPPEGVAVAREYLRGVTGKALLVLDAEQLLRLHA